MTDSIYQAHNSGKEDTYSREATLPFLFLSHFSDAITVDFGSNSDGLFDTAVSNSF